jgi:anaerobic ribonucleoside-triphosphate reductase activating protein
MGGDNDVPYLLELAWLIHDRYGDDLKVAWYSGRNEIYCNGFDYVKIGPYIKERGGLDNINTNQRLFKSNFKDVNNNMYWTFEDITYKLQNATPV